MHGTHHVASWKYYWNRFSQFVGNVFSSDWGKLSQHNDIEETSTLVQRTVNDGMSRWLGAIQVLRNADGGGGVSDFLEKSVTKA